MKFVAPKAGYYSISSKIIHFIPTGKFETIKNPLRRWWQFWKPEFIEREICEQKEIEGGVKLQLLSENQVVESSFQPVRL